MNSLYKLTYPILAFDSLQYFVYNIDGFESMLILVVKIENENDVKFISLNK